MVQQCDNRSVLSFVISERVPYFFAEIFAEPACGSEILTIGNTKDQDQAGTLKKHLRLKKVPAVPFVGFPFPRVYVLFDIAHCRTALANS